jgi:hypothetical protein
MAAKQANGRRIKMDRRYLAFDIEITKIVEGQDMMAHRPLGISVACTFRERNGQEDLRTWWGQGRPSGEPLAQMPQQQVCVLVCYLQECVRQGFTLLAWNGLHFDMNILAEESGMLPECQALAMGMVDPMFQVNQMLGYPVGLEGCAMAMTGQSKSGQAVDAPMKWAAGLYDEVMAYCEHDVQILYDVALQIEAQKRVDWFSRKGRVQSVNFPVGLLTVREVLDQIPGHPHPFLPLENFTGWLGGAS